MPYAIGKNLWRLMSKFEKISRQKRLLTQNFCNEKIKTLNIVSKSQLGIAIPIPSKNKKAKGNTEQKLFGFSFGISDGF